MPRSHDCDQQVMSKMTSNVMSSDNSKTDNNNQINQTSQPADIASTKSFSHVFVAAVVTVVIVFL